MHTDTEGIWLICLVCYLPALVVDSHHALTLLDLPNVIGIKFDAHT